MKTHESDNAQIIALQAVDFIARHQKMLDLFLLNTGLVLTDLLANLEKTETFAAVLDWLLQNEPSLLMFCAEVEMTPDLIWRARNQLPGAPVQQYQSV